MNATAYTEAFWARIAALSQTLDRMTYYNLLDVPMDAKRKVIEAAYYRRARNIHPDRHVYETDPQRRRDLVRLYARFGEAFRVLRDADLRRAYDAELAEGRVRLSNQARNAHRLAQQAPDPRTESARKLLGRGYEMIRAGNFTGAAAQLRLAAQLEPDSKVIARALEQCQRGVDSTG